MQSQFEFHKISMADDIFVAARIIAKANIPVAEKLGLTLQNAPSHPSFITPDALSAQISHERNFFLLYASDKPVGTIAIEPAQDDPKLFYIERLAVLPEAQKKGCGRALMDFAGEKIKSLGGTRASVAIINENLELKAWYQKLGYRETGTRIFEHLPFTVCFMLKELA